MDWTPAESLRANSLRLAEKGCLAAVARTALVIFFPDSLNTLRFFMSGSAFLITSGPMHSFLLPVVISREVTPAASGSHLNSRAALDEVTVMPPYKKPAATMAIFEKTS